MIKIQNHLGVIELQNSYFMSLIANVASSCFGVVRMAPAGAKQGVMSNIFNNPATDTGVRIRLAKDSQKMIIDLHIYVAYGINVSAIVASIINKVKYVVETETGIEVKKVNVFVDGMES